MKLFHCEYPQRIQLRTERGSEYPELSTRELWPVPFLHYCFNLQMLKMDEILFKKLGKHINMLGDVSHLRAKQFASIRSGHKQVDQLSGKG